VLTPLLTTFMLFAQEPVIAARGEARAVSPLAKVYEGDCLSGPFRIEWTFTVENGSRTKPQLVVSRGSASRDLSDTPLGDDLGRSGDYLGSGFACGRENVTWYLWVTRLTEDDGPQYLSGIAVLGPEGELVSYGGLRPAEYWRLQGVGGF